MLVTAATLVMVANVAARISLLRSFLWVRSSSEKERSSWLGNWSSEEEVVVVVMVG